MARFEVTAPDGARYEVNAPDGATEQDAIAHLQKQLGHTPAPAKEPEGSAIETADQALRGVYRSIDSVLALPGQIVGGAVNMVAPGQGDRFKWGGYVKPPSEYINGPKPPQNTSERYAERIGETVGSSIIPMAGIAAKARTVAEPATSVLGQIGQNIVNAYRTAPGTALATDAASAVASGAGQQAAAEGGAGPTGQMIAGLSGAALPGAAMAGVRSVGNALSRSPTIARYMGMDAVDAAENAPTTLSASANSNPLRVPTSPPISGAEAAAYQHLANRLTSANVPRGALANRLDQAEADSAIGNTRLALVDLDPSLQRLAGSVTRQSDDAGSIGQRFMAGRQTGITPSQGMPQNSGIPTREFMERPNPIDPPAGQFERVRDTTRAAMNVPQRSAYREDADVLNTMRQTSSPAYEQAYQAASGMDMAPVVEPIVSKWNGLLIDEPRPVAVALQKALRDIQRAVSPGGQKSQFERLDKVKQQIDDAIDRAFNATDNSRSRYLGGRLTELKNELLQSMDQVPNAGAAYAQARSIYSSGAEMREAIAMGRNALNDGAEISGEAYRNLTPGQQQAFRIGLADAIEGKMSGQARGHDTTKVFQSPKVQELLSEIIPQLEARRLGRNIQTENAMTRSSNEVFGNSKTAQRLADDEAFNQMSGIIETLRSSKSISAAAFKFTQQAIDKAFGFRADTATELAKKLFTADRAEIDRILAQIEARMGSDRTEMFHQLMAQYHSRVARSTASTAATSGQQDRRKTQRQPPRIPPAQP